MKNRIVVWPCFVVAAALFTVTLTFWMDVETAAGQSRKSAKESKTPLKPGDVDLGQSRAYVLVGKTGFGHDHGVVGRLKSGSVHLDRAKNVGQVVFDMRTFTADTPEARRYVGLSGSTSASTRDAVNKNMLGKDVLNVAGYPTATFDIATSALMKNKSRSGNPKYKLAGKFTLHGTTRPLTIEAEAIKKNGRIRLRAAFYAIQTQYGITPYSKAFGAVGVADRLTIYGEIYVATAGGDNRTAVKKR